MKETVWRIAQCVCNRRRVSFSALSLPVLVVIVIMMLAHQDIKNINHIKNSSAFIKSDTV